MEKKYEELLNKYCKELKLTKKVKKLAQEMVEEKDAAGVLLYKKYRNAIGGVIYISAILNGERRTQREVAEVIGCAEVTIRNTYKKIWKDTDGKYDPIL
jgi:transcription initiation factor TFIIB